MARSRPKFAQAPWTGLEAVRKIMERFSEFGENLNRMASALHNLENSMQHLLGVTSRVTAAMLLLHGSLGHVMPPSSRRGEGGSGDNKEKSKFSEKDWKEGNKYRFELKTAQEELRNARFAKSQIESALSQRARFNSNLVFKDMQYRRSRANREIQESALEPENILAQKESFHNMTAAADSDKPIDLKASKLVIDTEYGFVHDKDTPHDVAKGAYEHLSEKEQDQRKVLTEFSVRVVNSLGQTLDKFTKNIHHDLPGQEVYSLTAKTQAEQDAFAKALGKLKAKNKTVDISTASQELEAFAQKNNLNLASLAASDKPEDLKMVGRNLVNADFTVLSNSLNKQLGDTLGLNAIHPNNLKEQISDPLVVQFRSITAMLSSIKNPDAVANIAKSYGLNADELQALIKSRKSSPKQEEIAKVFNVAYKGGGAHTAESDTDVYARLLPRVESMFRILNTSLMREQILSKYGVTDAQLMEATKRAEEDHLLNPENKKLFDALEEESKRIEELTKKLEDLEKGKKDEEKKPDPEKKKGFWEKFKGSFHAFKDVDFSRLMQNGFDAVVEALKILPKQFAAGVTAIAGASMGLAQMASPDTFATFQGSLRMIGMQLGSSLIKPMLDFSYYLQLLAHNLANLSPQTQELIQNIGTWSIGLAAGAVAIKAIGMLVSPIYTVIKALAGLAVSAAAAGSRMTLGSIGALFSSMGSWILNFGKLTLGLVKFGGIIGIVTELLLRLSDSIFGTNLSLSKLLGDLNAKRAEKSVEDANKATVDAIYSKDSAELDQAQKNLNTNRDLVLRKTGNTTIEDRKKVKEFLANNFNFDRKLYGLYTSESNHPMVEARKSLGKVIGNQFETEAAGLTNRYLQAEDLYHTAKLNKDERTADLNLGQMAAVLHEYENLRVKVANSRNFIFTETPDKNKEYLADFNRAVQAQPLSGRVNPKGLTQQQLNASKLQTAQENFDKMGGFQGLAAAFQSFRSQPQYMGVEEAHRRIQIQALAMDPIEQKINEIQRSYLEKYLLYLGQIAANGPTDNKINNILNQGNMMLGFGKP